MKATNLIQVPIWQRKICNRTDLRPWRCFSHLIRGALFLFSLALSNSAMANTIYVAQNGTGSGSGADSSDCIAASSLNGSWSSLGVTTGTTISFVGQITIPLAVGGSDGSVANNVTMKFPAGAGILVASSALPSDYAIIRVPGNTSGLTIDGTGGGYLTLTGNGTGLATQYSTTAVLGEASLTSISVKNLHITGLYVHTGFTDTSLYADAVFGVNVPSPSGSNFVGGCYFQDVGDCVSWGNSAANWYIISNSFNRYNHGIFNSTSVGTASTVHVVVSNYFGSMTNWCTTSDAYHNDGIIWGNTGTIGVFAVTNNIFAGPIGGPTDNATAYIFSYANPANYVPIVNNLFINPPGDTLIGDGDILINGGNLYCINNTFLGNGNTTTALSMSGNGNFVVENNIFNNFQGFISVQGALSGSTIFANNLYGNAAGVDPWSLNGTLYSSYSSWASASGETGGATASGSSVVNTSTAAVPSGSPAIGSGNTNAYTMGVTSDITGNWRMPNVMDVGAVAVNISTNGGSGSKIQSTNGPAAWTANLKAALVTGGSSGSGSGQTNELNGLVLWWPLDGGNGTTTPDLSGQNYTGTLYSTPVWVVGEITNGLSFNSATSQYAGVTGPATPMSGLAVGTLCGWIKAASSGFTFGFNDTTGSRFSIESSGGSVYWCVENGTASFPSCSYTLDGNWHWFALVYTGATGSLASITAYIDGVQQTLTTGGVTPASTLSSSLGTFTIARSLANTTYYTMSADDVRLYNRALSAAEIADQFQWPTGGRP
jgi:hypothetical protein